MNQYYIKGNKMDSQTKEVMDILQEECAEVIQAVSKISRFGLDNLKPGKPKTNREHLEEELGDLYAMIEILQEMDVVSWTNIELAAEAKREKLKIWSNIFNKENV
jgi:NTP pyrophosphatase (non-canonical NTP hydrolase)